MRASFIVLARRRDTVFPGLCWNVLFGICGMWWVMCMRGPGFCGRDCVSCCDEWRIWNVSGVWCMQWWLSDVCEILPLLYLVWYCVYYCVTHMSLIVTDTAFTFLQSVCDTGFSNICVKKCVIKCVWDVFLLTCGWSNTIMSNYETTWYWCDHIQHAGHCFSNVWNANKVF